MPLQTTCISKQSLTYKSKLFPPAPSYLLQYKNKHVPNNLTAQTRKEKAVRLVEWVHGKHKSAINDAEKVWIQENWMGRLRSQHKERKSCLIMGGLNTCQLFLFNSAELFFNAIVSGNRSGLALIISVPKLV